MARNLVICCDGTDNQFGLENTNVVRLVQMLDRAPDKQSLYYDPGVGTLPEPSTFTKVGQKASMIYGLAIGGGIFWKIEQAYRYLMDFWEPSDRVYVFGFSRGAYTARLLCAVLHQMGLLSRGNHNLVPFVLRMFKSLPNDAEGAARYFRLANEFRKTFARVSALESDERRFEVHFLGLWDTVSSVGFAWEPHSFPFTARNPSVKIVRHAIALDERRWFFRQNRVYPATQTQSCEERWFPGVHSDVGGGYPELEGGLWRNPFTWITEEAEVAGLLVDQARRAHVMGRTDEPADSCTENQHESLTKGWWPLEFYPKLQWKESIQRRLPAIGAGRHRHVHEGALLDHCILTRISSRSDYRPSNLSTRFTQDVLALREIPDTMPYRA